MLLTDLIAQTGQPDFYPSLIPDVEITGIQFDSQMRRVMYNVKNHIGTWKEAECDLITDMQMKRENKLKILLD